MKKFWTAALSLLIVLAFFAGCAGTGNPSGASNAGEDGAAGDIPTLSVWSFTDELPTMISDYYLKDYPDAFVMDFTMVDSEEFEAKLDPALASGDAPDIWGINVAIVKKYVEGGVLADMSEFLSEAEAMRLADYTVSLGTDSSGVLRTLSFQATPGAVWYRRSIAEKYLGVSEPEDVQPLLADLESVRETAATLKEASGGACYYTTGLDNIWRYFDGQRQVPFVQDDKITEDPAIEEFFEYGKTFVENGYVVGVEEYKEDFYASMSDSLMDASGNPIEVFCYNNATWFGNFTITGNTASTDGTHDTYGDWAVCEGPSFFFNGGTFWGVYAQSKNLDIAKTLFQYLTLDEDFLTAYCGQTGDYPASAVVAEKLTEGMENELLGGQNHYEIFNAIAGNIQENYTDKYFDETVCGFMIDQAYEYANGNKDLDTALSDYRNNLMGQYPDITG